MKKKERNEKEREREKEYEKELEHEKDHLLQFYDEEINDNQHQILELYSILKQKKEKKKIKENEIRKEEREEIILSKSFLPPFLQERNAMEIQTIEIQPMKTKTNKLLKVCKEGSELVKRYKDQKERMKKTKQLIEKDVSFEKDILKKQCQHMKQEIKIQQEERDFFQKRKEILQKRKELPIYEKRNEIIQTIKENQIVLIIGETGSGKTTQIPQYLYESGCTKEGKIGITQPRRVATISVCERVSEEMNLSIGNEIGYSIRFEDKTSSKTKIKFMTEGILLQELLHDPFLNDYSIIIMDEIHERNSNTDILFGMMKQLLQRRNDLKFILMSATINEYHLLQYFGLLPIIRIEGKLFHVQVKYLKYIPDDYIKVITNQILYIHSTQDQGDILVFLTGQEDIEITKEILEDKIKQIESQIQPLQIIPFYSQLSNESQMKIFESSTQRKVILSTNIAETSITIPGIKYVIDSGLTKWKLYNSKIGMDILQIVPETKQNAEQRKGRAGRIEHGICYRMFTEKTFKEDFLDSPIPEIQRSNLNTILLQLKSIGIHHLQEFPFIDKPFEENIKRSLYELWLLKAINDQEEITPLGKELIEYPLDPFLSKTILISIKYQCIKEMIIIISMITIPNLMYQSKYDQFQQRKEKFYDEESDHISLLTIYKQWKQNKSNPKWYETYSFNKKAFFKINDIKKQLQDIVRKKGINPKLSCGNVKNIKKCLVECYFQNAAQWNGNEYITIRTGIHCKIHPSSLFYSYQIKPTYIIYHEVLLTNQSYIKWITEIKGKWLLELCPSFFQSYSIQ